MLMFGSVAAVVGVVLFHVALARTLRANPATRLPFWRNAGVIPAGSIAMRATGAGLAILGAVLLSTHAWYWPFLVVLAGPVVALAAITLHNRRVAIDHRISRS